MADRRASWDLIVNRSACIAFLVRSEEVLISV
jgi:hypothetical protein